MKNNKIKILREKNFDEFELVNQNGSRQYAGISEKDVTAREIEQTDKEGNKIKIWRIYCNNMHIASIDVNGKTKLTDEYRQLLKTEKSIDSDGKEIIGERWLQAMVPLRDRFSGKNIDDMDTRRFIDKIDMEQRIKDEEEKQYTKNRSKISVNKKDDKTPLKEAPKPEQVEQQLELPQGDIEACTVIKDKRFYENVPEARATQGFSMLAYSKSKNEYIVITSDDNGKCQKVDSIKPSKSTIAGTDEITKDKVENRAVANIMEVKGNNDIAYSARIEPGSSQITFQELRIDKNEQGNNKYISTEMYTSTQRPSREQVEEFSLKNNPSISDEKEIIKDYEEAGIQVTKFEAITERGRIENEILTMDEVEARISKKPQEVKEFVTQEIKGMEAHEITQEKIAEIIEEKEQQKDKEEQEERTPWGDAEKRKSRI